MTDIEKKALALVNEVSGSGSWTPTSLSHPYNRVVFKALCRAIEQHEAFRQEVSEALVEYFGEHLVAEDGGEPLARFIITKPVDQFVALVGEAVWSDPNEPDAVDCAASILEALAKRGGKIVWENE